VTYFLEVPENVTLAHWVCRSWDIYNSRVGFVTFDIETFFAFSFVKSVTLVFEGFECRRCEIGLNNYPKHGGELGDTRAGTLRRPIKPLGAAHDVRFLPRLNLCERFLPRIYKPWGDSASSHMCPFVVALGSFLLALASHALVVPCS
jgi:hypothetical protein